MVMWLIGLSGAGKTTIGREMCRLWKAKEPNTVLVDGDEIRRIFKHDQNPDAYSIKGRAANAERIAELCLWLDQQGINIVCCILSIFEETRAWNRSNYSKYFEVYVSVPLEILIERDSKGLYRRAKAGEVSNVVGIDIPFSPPQNSDWVFDNSTPGLDPEAAARQILSRAGIFPK